MLELAGTFPAKKDPDIFSELRVNRELVLWKATVLHCETAAVDVHPSLDREL